MSKGLRKGMSFLMAMIFVGSVLLLAGRLYDDRKAALSNQTAQELAAPSAGQPAVIPEAPVPLESAPEKEPLPAQAPAPARKPVPDREETAALWEPLREEMLDLLALDLEALRRQSGSVLGWIRIPGSVIDYPLMAFEDNETGLHQSWDVTKSSAGCIFLECKNRRDLSDFNTLIYGHNMRSGEMFGTLKRYAQADYLQEHKEIYLVTDDCVRRYEVFSAYEAAVTSDTYRLYFPDDAAKQQALAHYTAAGSDTVPTVNDRILTLSTCIGNGTYRTRWVVQAVLTGEFSR